MAPGCAASVRSNRCGATARPSGRSGGFLTGVDRGITPDLTLGIAGGYRHTDLSQSDGTSGTVETPQIIAYGLYRAGPVALEGTLGLAYDRISTSRPSSRAPARMPAKAITNAALQATYPLALGDMVLMPQIGPQYVRLDETKFAESGAGSFDLAAESSYYARPAAFDRREPAQIDLGPATA